MSILLLVMTQLSFAVIEACTFRNDVESFTLDSEVMHLQKDKKGNLLTGHVECVLKEKPNVKRRSLFIKNGIKVYELFIYSKYYKMSYYHHNDSLSYESTENTNKFISVSCPKTLKNEIWNTFVPRKFLDDYCFDNSAKIGTKFSLYYHEGTLKKTEEIIEKGVRDKKYYTKQGVLYKHERYLEDGFISVSKLYHKNSGKPHEFRFCSPHSSFCRQHVYDKDGEPIIAIKVRNEQK